MPLHLKCFRCIKSIDNAKAWESVFVPSHYQIPETFEWHICFLNCVWNLDGIGLSSWDKAIDEKYAGEMNFEGKRNEKTEVCTNRLLQLMLGNLCACNENEYEMLLHAMHI